MSQAESPRQSDKEFITRDEPLDSSRQEFTHPPRRSYRKVAFWLALATFVSTFWAGVTTWAPQEVLGSCWEYGSLLPLRAIVLANMWQGLQFSLALMGILAAHEFGHYLLTIYYRVPSTPPLFIPFPLSPLGTFGAVIAMHGGEADRREIFDIGLAGPLAGLVVTIPVLIWGLLHPQPFEYAPFEVMEIGQPLLFQWIAATLPALGDGVSAVGSNARTDPLVMAGWVGLLVTGLNMIPLGQLDGGHVAFGLMGGKSRYLGMAVAAAAASYMIYAQVFLFAVMLFLAIMMGFRHPPSRDDSRRLGWFRSILGWLSLAIPVLCIPANPLMPL